MPKIYKYIVAIFVMLRIVIYVIVFFRLFVKSSIFISNIKNIFIKKKIITFHYIQFLIYIYIAIFHLRDVKHFLNPNNFLSFIRINKRIGNNLFKYCLI